MTAGDLVAELAGTRMGRRLTTPWARGADVVMLSLHPGAAGVLDVQPYDFADHEARFGRAPQPAYVLRTMEDRATATTLVVTVEAAGGDQRIEVRVPAGALAGQSFLVPLPAGTDAKARLRTVAIPTGTTAGWSVTALLGTTAKLLWAVGWERDNLRRHADRTVAQRRLASAVGASLDLIGTDLAVPRFPALPYRYDRETVALYHCDDARQGLVEDFAGRFPGHAGHDGTLSGGATHGAPGRFGAGIAMTDASSAVLVPVSTDFDVPAGQGLTVECFVQPAADSHDGRVVGRRGQAGPGWEIALGEFGRGLPRSVRVRVANADRTVEVFGAASLPTNRFTHVALVLSPGTAGTAGTLALFQDGRLVASTATGALGAVASNAPLQIGPAGTGFRGIVDEVRVSSVARTHFSPVLGEDDERYRHRLELFRGWVLPTRERLQTLLNEIVGPVGDVADALVVDDADAEIIRDTTVLRVVPARLLAGESIDASGRRRVAESDLYDPDGDAAFDPALLSRHDRAGVSYAPAPPRSLLPGEPPPDPHLVQRSALAALDRLVALTAPAGSLTVERAFDPRGSGGHPTGRAVAVRHNGLPPGRLAALAHRAGFDFVACPPRGGEVYCSCAPGALVSVVVPPVAAVGAAFAPAVEPPLPRHATVRYRVIPLGPGRARVVIPANDGRADDDRADDDPANDDPVTVVGDRPGRVLVAADVTRGARTVSAQATVTLLPAPLADGASIAADGTLGVAESVVGPPADSFDPAYLVRVENPTIDFGSGAQAANRRRMQSGVAARLAALSDRLDRDVLDGLTVTAGFDPGAAGLARQGRALTIRHATLDAGVLAVHAHAVGFGYVRRDGADVHLRHGAEPLVRIEGPRGPLEEGQAAVFTIRPALKALPATARLTWSTGSLTAGRAALSPTTDPADPPSGVPAGPGSSEPAARVVGTHAGTVWLQAALRDRNALDTHQVEVRLSRAAADAGAKLTLDQYDLIMNALHALHPVGVEFVTAALRQAVVELAGDAQTVDPRYTYPRYRLHRSTARLAAPPRRTGG